MSRRGENIYKRKDGRWEGRYIRERVDVKARYAAVYARSYGDVKRKLEEAREVAANSKKSISNMERLTDIAGAWLSEAEVSLKKSSVNKYEDILRCYILPQFGDNRLSEITDGHIAGFVKRLLLCGGAKGQGLTSATVSEILSAMNSIRVYALKRGYVVGYSMECISLKRTQGDIRVFSLEEERLLLKYLQEHMNLSSLGILLCLFTGIRVGELCAMKWDDISLSEKSMQVGRTMQRLRTRAETGNRTKVCILQPKSSASVRIIPLPDMIMGLLEEFHTPGTFFLTGDDSRYVEPRTMQNRFKKILTACGIRDANFHATRHTFATRCVELGFDVKSLSEILGHASVAITMNRYVHPSMAFKAEHMNRFSDLFAVR